MSYDFQNVGRGQARNPQSSQAHFGEPHALPTVTLEPIRVHGVPPYNEATSYTVGAPIGRPFINKLGFIEMLVQTLFTNICNLVGTGVPDGPFQK